MTTSSQAASMPQSGLPILTNLPLPQVSFSVEPAASSTVAFARAIITKISGVPVAASASAGWTSLWRLIPFMKSSPEPASDDPLHLDEPSPQELTNENVNDFIRFWSRPSNQSLANANGPLPEPEYDNADPLKLDEPSPVDLGKCTKKD